MVNSCHVVIGLVVKLVTFKLLVTLLNPPVSSHQLLLNSVCKGGFTVLTGLELLVPIVLFNITTIIAI